MVRRALVSEASKHKGNAQHDAATSMLHYGEGFHGVSSVRFPLKAKHFSFGLIGPDNLFFMFDSCLQHGTATFGKLQTGRPVAY